MSQYFSTFISGTEDIVKEVLTKQIKTKIILLLNGLIIYETKTSINELRKIRFFNNTYILIKQFKDLGKNPIERMIKEIIKIPDNKIKKEIPNSIFLKKKTFKITNLLENQTIKTDYSLLGKLEKKIFQITGLKLDIKKTDIEFIILARREKIGFFGIRITYRSRYRKKGEIRSELSNILCLISEPNKDDIVLDVFAGSGSIIKERIYFPYLKIIALDSNKKLINNLKIELKEKDIDIKLGDALNSYLKSSSIDKIITDPPWGLYKKTNISLNDFYLKMLNEFYRILKPNKLAVVLIGNKEVFENSLEKLQDKFIKLNKFDVLVSGKKASIYKIKKLKELSTEKIDNI